MNNKVDREGVHITHCCVIHGCKYGDSDCPVENKMILQEYLCEQCSDGYEGYTFKQIEEVFAEPIGVRNPLTILEKLKVIEDNKCIYNIHYCKAGVGISFYYAENDTTGIWKDAISTDRYYKDFETCIASEYSKLRAEQNNA